MITKKTKIFAVFSALFFLGSISTTFFVWQYAQSEGEVLLNQAKEVADFEAREKTYRTLENLIETTQQDRDELSTYVLTEEGTIDFLATVERLAVEQGVTLNTNSLRVLEGKGLFDTLVISYSLEGKKAYVDSMLLLMETLPYHSFVSDVRLEYSSVEGVRFTKGTVELTISLLNYDR